MTCSGSCPLGREKSGGTPSGPCDGGVRCGDRITGLGLRAVSSSRRGGVVAWGGSAEARSTGSPSERLRGLRVSVAWVDALSLRSDVIRSIKILSRGKGLFTNSQTRPLHANEGNQTTPTLEATHRQILSQSPTDATSSRKHLYGS